MFAEQNYADFIFLFLGSQRKSDPVWSVIHRLGYLHNFLCCFWIDSASVIQYSIDGAAGYARQVGNLFDSSHEMPPKNTLY